ncbi:hypothetical protein MC885_017033 [Smutsia gigantea]|nr:hypothetical protein MC885_017033 [Smutsia gigantea]
MMGGRKAAVWSRGEEAFSGLGTGAVTSPQDTPKEEMVLGRDLEEKATVNYPHRGINRGKEEKTEEALEVVAQHLDQSVHPFVRMGYSPSPWLICCPVTATESKIYTHCKLAKIFRGLAWTITTALALETGSAWHTMRAATIPRLRLLDDGGTHYGIFQINSLMWCRHAKLQEKNYCHVACCSALFTDDLTDAVTCAKKIVKETEGMKYWQGWKKHCEGRDLSEWKKGCDVS